MKNKLFILFFSLLFLAAPTYSFAQAKIGSDSSTTQILGNSKIYKGLSFKGLNPTSAYKRYFKNDTTYLVFVDSTSGKLCYMKNGVVDTIGSGGGSSGLTSTYVGVGGPSNTLAGYRDFVYDTINNLFSMGWLGNPYLYTKLSSGLLDLEIGDINSVSTGAGLELFEISNTAWSLSVFDNNGTYLNISQPNGLVQFGAAGSTGNRTNITENDVSKVGIQTNAVAYPTMQSFTSGTKDSILQGFRGAYINPSSLLATDTIILPLNPVDGQELLLSFGGTITTGLVVTALFVKTNTGDAIIGDAVYSPHAGDNILYKYSISNHLWRGSILRSGTVTSIGLIMPPAFTVAPATITSSGTFSVTASGLQNQFYAAPSGGDGTLGLRSIISSDLPTTGTAGTYGDATHIPGITTDIYGRVTAVTTYSVSVFSPTNSYTWTATQNFNNLVTFGSINITSGISLSDGATFGIGSGSGTSIGSSSSKLSFYGVTPIAKPSGDIITALSAYGLISSPTLSTTDITVGSTQTTVSGSTSGNAKFSEPFRTSDYKNVIIYCNALLGTATYTFPVTFTNTPVILATNGLASTIITALSTSAVTVTGATSTGFLVIEGY